MRSTPGSCLERKEQQPKVYEQLGLSGVSSYLRMHPRGQRQMVSSTHTVVFVQRIRRLQHDIVLQKAVVDVI